MNFLKITISVFAIVVIICISLSMAGEKQSPISGTFVSFAWHHQNWDQLRWAKEFEAMAKLKFDTLIIQSVARLEPDSDKVISYYSSKSYQTKWPHVDWILNEADRRDWKVYLGGVADDTGEYDNDPEFVELSKKIADELYSSYKMHKSFAGYYIATEPLLNEAGKYGKRAIYKVYGKYLKEKYPEKKVVLSPYFITDASVRCKKSGLKKWWHDRNPKEMAKQATLFLKNCPVDIVALQDSTCWDVTMDDLRKYLPEISQNVQAAGREFWVDMEVFDTYGHTTYAPAPIQRIMEQIEVEKKYKCVMYTFNWCMDPNGTEHSKALYEQYYNAYFK
ncbi:MAG: DUF4434 domain-containing protein [Phycisphaerales bacterium]